MPRFYLLRIELPTQSSHIFPRQKCTSRGSKRYSPLNRLRLCEDFYTETWGLWHVIASAEAGRPRRPQTVRIHLSPFSAPPGS